MTMAYYGILIPTEKLLEILSKSSSVEDQRKFLKNYSNRNLFDTSNIVDLFAIVCYTTGLCEILRPGLVEINTKGDYVFLGCEVQYQDINIVNKELEKHNLLGFQPRLYDANPFDEIPNLKKEKLA